MAAEKLPSSTRPRPAFKQGRPCGGAYGEASLCVGAAAPTPRRFSPRLGGDQGDRGGAISPAANGGGGGRGDVVLALPAAARHVCPICSKIFDRIRALNGHKRSCRLPVPANLPAPRPEQQESEKKPRLAAETSWVKTKPRNARVRSVLPSSAALGLAVQPADPTVIVIDDDEEEAADSAVEMIDSSVVTIAISGPHSPPAIVPAAPAPPSVPPAMAFWTFSAAAAAAAFDHGCGAASGGPMASHQNAHRRPPVIGGTRLFGADVFFVVQAGSNAE